MLGYHLVLVTLHLGLQWKLVPLSTIFSVLCIVIIVYCLLMIDGMEYYSV